MQLARFEFSLCSVLALLAVGACSVGRPAGNPAAVVASPTFTAIATLTPPQTPAETATPVPTVQADSGGGQSAYFAEVTAENVNLRTRPGTVFPVRLLLAKGSSVQVLGHAPGGEWLYVQTDAGVNGWLLYWLVNGGHDGGPTPLIQPTDVQVIRGRIIDRAGVPVSGIGFAVTQGSGPNAPRTDATSDAEGMFYAYVPNSTADAWFISYVSVACKSNTMDARCNCIGTCGKADPESVKVVLPSETILQFTWK